MPRGGFRMKKEKPEVEDVVETSNDATTVTLQAPELPAATPEAGPAVETAAPAVVVGPSKPQLDAKDCAMRLDWLRLKPSKTTEEKEEIERLEAIV